MIIKSLFASKESDVPTTILGEKPNQSMRSGGLRLPNGDIVTIDYKKESNYVTINKFSKTSKRLHSNTLSYEGEPVILVDKPLLAYVPVYNLIICVTASIRTATGSTETILSCPTWSIQTVKADDLTRSGTINDIPIDKSFTRGRLADVMYSGEHGGFFMLDHLGHLLFLPYNPKDGSLGVTLFFYPRSKKEKEEEKEEEEEEEEEEGGSEAETEDGTGIDFKIDKVKKEDEKGEDKKKVKEKENEGKQKKRQVNDNSETGSKFIERGSIMFFKMCYPSILYYAGGRYITRSVLSKDKFIHEVTLYRDIVCEGEAVELLGPVSDFDHTSQEPITLDNLLKYLETMITGFVPGHTSMYEPLDTSLLPPGKTPQTFYISMTKPQISITKPPKTRLIICPFLGDSNLKPRENYKNGKWFGDMVFMIVDLVNKQGHSLRTEKGTPITMDLSVY